MKKSELKRIIKESINNKTESDLGNIEMLSDKALGILNNIENFKKIIDGMENSTDNPLELLNDIDDNQYIELRFFSEKLEEYSQQFEFLKNYGIA